MAYYNNNPYAVYPNVGGYNVPQQQMNQQPYQQTQPVMMAQQNVQQVNPALTVRYVAGREEAVASQVLPDGNMCVFVDIAHGMIYTKQINPQTMACSFMEYQRLIPVEQTPQQNSQQFASLDDRITALRKDVDDIMTMLTSSTQQPKQTNAERR